MSMKNTFKNCRAAFGIAFMAVAFMIAFSGPSANVWAAKGDLETLMVKANKPLSVPLGKAELIDLSGDVADVLIADPEIIDVQAVQSNRLYVVGLNVGDTNIIALDANGDVVKRLDVHVAYDLAAIQSLVDELFPDEAVKVGAIHDQILLTGKVSTPEVAGKVTNIVGHYVADLTESSDPIDRQIGNLLEIRGEQQVMLQVKIVEASRSVLKEFGLETYLNDPTETAATTIFGATPVGSNTSRGDNVSFATGAGIALSQEAAGIAGTVFETGLRGVGLMALELNALEEENLVNILAEPNLTTVSGEEASFLAGGEFPVPVGRDNVGNLVIEFREFGVSLNFRPVVMSDKRINMKLKTEVSSLDFDNAVSAGDIRVPGLDIRRADTTVEMPSGGSLMIAGLLQSDSVKGMTGLPGIRKTPVLGDLVSSESFQREETELIVIVTPYMVEPYAEKTRAQHVPRQKSNKLAQAFAANIRRVFDVEDDLFAYDDGFGYILD